MIEIKNLSKAFKALKAVDDLSLSVPAGTIFGFLGPNGAGKSTTIRMLLNLLKPDSGDIRLQGKSLAAEKNGALAGVGAFVEEPDFYKNLSARRNLRILARLAGTVDEKRIDEVLEIVDLYSRADDNVKSYSRGMRQRLGIAQALLHHPRLLILDEPTSSLDPAGIRDMRQLILRLARDEGITIFLSSHLLHEVEQMCTHLAVVHMGRLVKTGTVDTLLHSSEFMMTEFQVSDSARAAELLDSDSQVSKVNAEGKSVKVSVDRSQIGRLTRLLVENGLEVSAVIPRTSLEDYFISITEEAPAP